MKTTFIRTYSDRDKLVGWFQVPVNKLPLLINCGGVIYQLRPAVYPIKNPCYKSIGSPSIINMMYTELNGEKV